MRQVLDRPRQWRPGGFRMAQYELPQPSPDAPSANGNGTSEMGLAILAALSIAGIHAAISPSYFTMRAFGSKPEARHQVIEGLIIGLGLSTLASAGLYLVFNRWLPAIVSEATALALFGIGIYAVNAPPLETVAPIQQQSP